MLLAILAALPTPARGQARSQPPPQPPARQAPAQPPPGDTTELVFGREVFSYPEIPRRDPFRPLVGGEGAGPRFEDLRLLGIIYSQDPGRSVALFAQVAAQGGGAQARPRSYPARRGDVIGNMRVLEIHPDRVVVQVEEFGLFEQRVLELKKPAEGAPK